MNLHALILPALALIAGACGGGGTAPATAPVATAALRGMVVEVDGQTRDRGDVPLTLVELGRTATTDADGRFAFGDVPAGRLTLAVEDPALRSIAQDAGDDNSNSGPSGDDSFDDDSFDDDSFDDDGRPVLDVSGGDSIDLRITVEDGRIVGFARLDDDGTEVRVRLQPADSNPYPGSEGEVEVEQEFDGDRKLELEVDHVPPGTVVEFFLQDGDGGFVSVGTAVADASGEAELEFENVLPLGAADLDALEGVAVEMRLASDGTLLFAGSIPGIPDPVAATGTVDDAARARSRTRLVSLVAGAEGDVEMRRRPDQGEVEFEIDAEHLDPGIPIRFEIEDPDDPGSFVTVAARITDATGEADYDTDDGLPLPLGVSDIGDLVGLEVRVVRDDGSDELLMFGTIAPLVAD